MPAPDGAQAVRRALQLLQGFGEAGSSASVTDLARRSGLTLSTTHRLLKVLAAEGFLTQDPDTARYQLGPAVIELGRLAYRRRALQRAEPELADLALRTGATADLALRWGAYAVIVSGGSVEHDQPGGLRRPLHSTALGKVLLAWSPDEERLDELGPLEPLTSRTITDPASLADELARVREQGYAVNDGESALGVRTIAVPVRDAAGRARFALALRSSPTAMPTARLGWFVDQATACAAALEVLLIPPAQRRAQSGRAAGSA